MEFTVGNKIRIKNANVTIKQYCKNNLVIQNPEYYRKQKMGKWTGSTPKIFYLYEMIADDLVLPFGCFQKLWQIYPDRSVYTNAIRPFEKISFNSSIKLYPYQEKAVQAAQAAKNGIIVMPCGSGKTQTALELVARIGGRTLWLTHTQDLLRQSMNRAKSVFDIQPEDYGTITEGKVNVGNKITFATVQTMSKINLDELKHTFNVVIVDECHKAVGSPTRVMQFYKVLSALSARYKYGLTATPNRSDGLEKSMFALLGETCAKVGREAVKDTTCPIEVSAVNTGYVPNMNVVLAGDGTLNYSSLIQDLTSDEGRFKKVLGIVSTVGKCGPTLVLANRVEYLKKMHEQFEGKSVCLSGMRQSKRAKDERKKALEDLNNGGLDCIFATYQLAKEGLDIPNLRYLILTTPEKDKTTVTQAVGRVGRYAENKEKGLVIDFIDNFGMYQGWWKKRLNIYKKLGCKILRAEDE